MLNKEQANLNRSLILKKKKKKKKKKKNKKFSFLKILCFCC